MNKNLCSITFIVYGRLQYTKMSFESLIENTTYPYELIVVNNNSDKETEEYLWSQRDKIDHLIFNKKNLGKVNANNIGWRISRGEYIATVENDILLTKNWLTVCIKYLNLFPEIGIISPTNHDLDRFERGKTKIEETDIYVKDNKECFLIPKIGVIPGTIVAKRKTIETIGLHKTSGKLYEHSCPDYCNRVKFSGYLAAYPFTKDLRCYHVDIKNKIFNIISKKYNFDENELIKQKNNNIKIKNDDSDKALIFKFLDIK